MVGRNARRVDWLQEIAVGLHHLRAGEYLGIHLRSAEHDRGSRSLPDRPGRFDPVHISDQRDVHQDQIRLRLQSQLYGPTAGVCPSGDLVALPLQRGLDQQCDGRRILHDEDADHCAAHHLPFGFAPRCAVQGRLIMIVAPLSFYPFRREWTESA
jgi:hypothetical protein